MDIPDKETAAKEMHARRLVITAERRKEREEQKARELLKNTEECKQKFSKSINLGHPVVIVLVIYHLILLKQ